MMLAPECTSSDETARSAGLRTELVLERSDRVLWTIARKGILLHNIEQRLFFELDQLGYLLWSYLDGGRTVADVLTACCPDAGRAGVLTRRIALDIVETLFTFGFVQEREDGVLT
jgi:hypothetical protein